MTAFFSQSPEAARTPVIVVLEIQLLVAIIRAGVYLKLSYESDCRKLNGKERLRYWPILFKVVTLRQLDNNDGKSTILLGLHMTLKIVAASVGLGPSFQKPVFYLLGLHQKEPKARGLKKTRRRSVKSMTREELPLLQMFPLPRVSRECKATNYML
ncbi:hypothetical protein BN1723_015697 [Verticillium longisporum]|uniref:Uncharacterized protein n=1 Tax=Verticillium longisporum TaxID=100787 RepID=A0A0G4N1G2_VERLO|nr:hypothetical protein BN1723_015697 [Verticillium longisporum]